MSEQPALQDLMNQINEAKSGNPMSLIERLKSHQTVAEYIHNHPEPSAAFIKGLASLIHDICAILICQAVTDSQ